MPVFGIHAFVWNGDWNNEIAPETIRLSEAAGYDLLEIPLLHPEDTDVPLIRRLLRDHHLQAACSLALPKALHLPANPQGARAFLMRAVEVTEAIGVTRLCGCLYCHLGTLTGVAPTAAERAACVEILSEVAEYAHTKGISIGIEPVNRYETYLYNVVSDTLNLLNAIPTETTFVHFDTYHMIIEEQGYGAAIREAGVKCAYIHLSESGRGIPGMGNVDWDDVFSALSAIEYSGPLTLEAFAAVNADLTAATCLWRPPAFTPQEIATRGLEFIRAKAEAYHLA